MTISDALHYMKTNKGPMVWTIPIISGPIDSLSADVIDFMVKKIGEDRKQGEIIDLAQSVLWLSITIASLWRKKEE